MDWLDLDRRHCWHPYTQHTLEGDPLPVVSAEGARLTLADGRTLIDAISSWWATLHGHGRPEIVDAIARQARTLDHVLFAGAAHEPAARLAERLVSLAPAGLDRVFFSDDGSTAVEVALKMAIQRWRHLGEPERTVFVALEGAYHGDTFGAMSVGDPDPFFEAFGPLLFRVERVPPEERAVRRALERLGRRAAGLVIEPLVQGAAGMRMHGEAFVRSARAAADDHGVPLIADEVMTGFGRTGALFACERAGVSPDLLCLSKGLTGGTLPLACTLATERFFEAFAARRRDRMFFHGHTFTANPIACAAALASLDLVERERTPERLDRIGRRIEARLAPRVAADERFGSLRRTGGIVAFDVRTEAKGYLADVALRIRREAIERGVLLRPLGEVLYALPPSCLTDDEADRVADAMIEAALRAIDAAGPG